MNLLKNAGLLAQKELTKENLERIIKIGDLSYKIAQIYELAKKSIENAFNIESSWREFMRDEDGFLVWLND